MKGCGEAQLDEVQER